MNEPVPVVLYSRPGCHLCDEMKAVAQRVARSVPIILQEVDISADAELMQRYGTEIPVMVIGGRKVAKYRISEEELIRSLERATRDEARHAGK